jgi:Asp-tRNA(Asn)/Glu-tRNA(Gln) amidotransferase A subunit family amidase
MIQVYNDLMKKSMMKRRKLLLSTLSGAGGAALASRSLAADADSMWCGFDERITERTLAEAEKLFGLQLTSQERQLMLAEGSEEDFFGGQRQLLQSIRQIDKPNALAPALVFDPRLPGIAYPPQENRVDLLDEAIPALPTDAELIAFAPVKHQAHWLDSGRLSSLELTEIYLDRIERFGPRLECFITVTADLARRQAAEADRERAAGRKRGPLHGIPYGLKDLADTAGIETTWGANTHRGRVPRTDAAVVRLLAEAGAVLLGKTTLGALAWGDVWYGGITRNPWNPEEGSSGSSAGSASATAAGLCSFSIGSETWGSIGSPSGICGTTGLRPTFGRVPRTGVMALCWSLDKLGPICRYAEDTALVLAAVNAYDPEDAGSLEHGLEYAGTDSVTDLVVGYDPRWFDREKVRPADMAALAALRDTGVSLKEVSLPDLPWRIMMPILNTEASAAFADLTLSGRDDDLRQQIADAWPNYFRFGRFFSAVDYLQCDRIRRKVMRQLHEFFSSVDAVFGPDEGHNLSALTNLSGHPMITLRAGFEDLKTRPRSGVEEHDVAETKYPVPRNVQFWGSLFSEPRLILLARALEENLSVASARPPSVASGS